MLGNKKSPGSLALFGLFLQNLLPQSTLLFLLIFPPPLSTQKERVCLMLLSLIQVLPIEILINCKGYQKQTYIIDLDCCELSHLKHSYSLQLRPYSLLKPYLSYFCFIMKPNQCTNPYLFVPSCSLRHILPPIL